MPGPGTSDDFRLFSNADTLSVSVRLTDAQFKSDKEIMVR